MIAVLYRSVPVAFLVIAAACSLRQIDQRKTRGGGPETEHHGNHHITEGAISLSVPCQVQRLQTEGRDRGVAAKEADYGEQPCVGQCEQGGAFFGQPSEDSNQERSTHIDEKRAPGE